MSEEPKRKYKKSTIITEGADKPAAPKHRHYIDNTTFLAAIKERKAALKEAEEKGLEPPRITEFLGECVLKIATNLAKKGNFAGYQFKDDMISDAVQVCIRYLDKFDPEKSDNPFSYFTQTCTYAFIGRINTEQKHQYVKMKATLGVVTDGAVAECDDQSDEVQHLFDNMEFDTEYASEFIGNYEKRNFTKKEKVVELKGLDKFIGDELGDE